MQARLGTAWCRQTLRTKDDRVIRLWKTLAGLALALPLFAQAQSKLILPQTQDDIRRLTERADAGPCVNKCGVVTDVRSASRQPGPSRASATPPASGIGGDVTATPIIGRGSAVKDARNANKPITFYKMTVRFDDGTYAFFEQDDEPAAKKGDKVEISEGRVVRRTEQ